jgi:hypothetical protein
MKRTKVSVNQVMSDMTTNPFWKSLRSNPNYTKFEQTIAETLSKKEKCCNGNCNQVRNCTLRKS